MLCIGYFIIVSGQNIKKKSILHKGFIKKSNFEKILGATKQPTRREKS